MNLSRIEGWETPHTRTDDNTFYSDNAPKRTFFSTLKSFPQPPPRKLKKNWALECRSERKGLWPVVPWTEARPRVVVNILKTQDRELQTNIFHSSITCIWLIRSSYVSTMHIYVILLSDTCYSGVLIQVGTEQLRNKQIFIYSLLFSIISLKGVLFKTKNLFIIWILPFNNCCSNIKKQLTLSLSLLYLLWV